ncbi:MAG: DNA-directed RNA polymerase subunit beta [bacterium]|nr:DNA-directed RNA polymerase subunit beta [bacterium]
MTLAANKRDRVSYAKIPTVLELPNLIDLQRNAYQWFIDAGLRELLDSFSPVQDFTGNLVLEFLDYAFDEPKYSVDECRERDMTYSVPLKVQVRLINRVNGEVKEQEVFMGDFPLMTSKGTFVINGAERVIVSQLARSPGVYFKSELDPHGNSLYSATMIPNRGAWIELEFDANGVMWVRVDRTRKIPATVLLRALEYRIVSDQGTSINRITESSKPKKGIVGLELAEDVVDPDTGEVLAVRGAVLDEEAITALKDAAVKEVSVIREEKVAGQQEMGVFDQQEVVCQIGDRDRIDGKVLADDAADAHTGEVLAEKGSKLTDQAIGKLVKAGITEVKIYEEIKVMEIEDWLRLTMEKDSTSDADEAIVEIYRKLRPGEPLTMDGAKMLFRSLFFDQKRYDLAHVGRYKINKKLGLNIDHLQHVLTRTDIIETVRYLKNLPQGVGSIDDIDHLGNRRVRAVGELLLNQFRVGLLRMERVIRERMIIQETETLTPQALINIRPVVAAIKEFFGSSQLSQFMDQTNPLAELTHKRRLSALGPGGLSRERAGFEVRDVHHSHYGRICPIETPEGPNIGLIGSMATYARVNEYGFIETPYRKVVNRHVLDEIVYLSADEEDNYILAQANEPVDEKGYLISDRVPARAMHVIEAVPAEKLDFMDASPKQLVSVATALIPFLENDDANRALMGSNMQRQAVPLLRTEAPVVGTGMERKVAIDSGAVIVADRAGIIKAVSAERVIVQTDDGELDTYRIYKFMRSNQGTSINQHPVVSLGQRVEKGEVLADGASTDRGELALGRNVLVAFMPWKGYNYEDAILLSERMVKEDVFTSIHIEEYEIEARDTKLGPEEITRDIPNVSEDVLKDLDERGVIRIGAEVRAEDILVGKVTPKGETELTPEERLLRAIFGEKAREVRDTSLRVPHGEKGRVVDVKVFKRESGDELSPGVNELVRVYIAQKRKILEGDKMAGRHGNKGVIARILPEADMPFLPDGTAVDIVLNPLGVPSRMNIGQILETHFSLAAREFGTAFENPVFDGATEDEVTDSIVRVVENKQRCELKEYMSTELMLEVPAELDDKPLDEIPALLSGILTGMDNEDLFELARIVAMEVDEESFKVGGSRSQNIMTLVEGILSRAYARVGLLPSGKTILRDGMTGEPFDRPVTIGYLYMMKLAHLVDDKIHARSTGPYSLVTQQPLGGKAQFGGQRFGEMEVWALEAYGAAFTLQELLTIKSDDVMGRVKAYEAIVKGENVQEPGVPESFKVLIKELQSLGLDAKILSEEAEEVIIKEDEIDLAEAARELGVEVGKEY